jgi:hypothetical protein
MKKLVRGGLALVVGLAGLVGATVFNRTASADGLPPYPIREYLTDQCLTTHEFIPNGTPAATATCGLVAPRLRQRWIVTRVEDPTGGGRPAITIKGMDNGRCLDADNRTLFPFMEGQRGDFVVQMWACNGWANQTWIVTSYVQALADFGLTGQRERRSAYTVTNLPASAQIPFQLRSAGGPANPPRACRRAVVGPYLCEPWLAGSQPGRADNGQLLGADYSLAGTIVLDSPVIQCALAGRGRPVQVNTTDLFAFRCS